MDTAECISDRVALKIMTNEIRMDGCGWMDARTDAKYHTFHRGNVNAKECSNGQFQLEPTSF